MGDKRGRLLTQVMVLHNWLEEHCFDITETQASHALNELTKVWSILERRKGGR